MASWLAECHGTSEPSQVGHEHNLPLEATSLDASVRVRDGIETNAFGDAGLDRTTRQQGEECIQVGAEPVGVSLSRRRDREEAGGAPARERVPPPQFREPEGKESD